MENRKQDLLKLQHYIDNVDKETTFLLQNLQWDHKCLLESPAMVSCKYVAEHRMPLHAVEAHEKQCYLRQQGYRKEDILLPDLSNPNADTVVKLSKHDIKRIIDAAAHLDPSFKRGSAAAEPMTVERLQLEYSADERRAIHDAVVAAAPACHDLADLALPSSSGSQAEKSKSRAEILAELRDMKRRRARYRVAAKTCNYSHVLRDVIKTQMDLYAEAKGIFIKTEYGSKNYVSLNESTESEMNPTNTVIKQERITPEPNDYNDNSSRHRERSIDSKRQTSRNSDRRRQRKEDRRVVARHRQEDLDTGSRERRFQDRTDTHEKRRHDDYSKRDSYKSTRDTTDSGSNRYSQTAECSSSRNSSYNDRKSSKYENDRSLARISSNKDYKSRSHREDSSKKSEYEHRRSDDEYNSRYSGSKRYREDKHNRYYNNEIKKEKVDYYEDYRDDRNKRQKN